MAATTPLREVLNEGISSGSFVDTKIILYSYRDSSGRVCRPKAVYTNSRVLKLVPYFNDLLFGNFPESQSKDFGKEVLDDKSAEDYGYLSDSDLEDDEDEKVALSKHANESKVYPVDPSGVSGGDRKIHYEEYEKHVENGKVVNIPDVAFVTFQAFLMYLYTDSIEFAPFGSDENRRSRSAEIVTPSGDKVPRPSPKSIYRLADKYGVPALKTLALNHILSELGKCDIAEEAFGRFASRYDEIRNLYIEQLAYVWMEDSTTEATRANVDKKIDSFVNGELKHAAVAVFALLEIANKTGDIAAPSNTSSAVTQVTSPAHWASVKTALVKSIREGVLFDRKYWVRHSKTGDTLKPIYFSSIIMGDKVEQLKGLVKYISGRNTPISYLGEGANVDSDCEDYPTRVDDETLKKDQGEEESRAVLIAGSFSAWKSLFFYRCTDAISFAPLKSQRADPSSNDIHNTPAVAAPPPCSPKTIYVLASLLEIQPLCDSAFADIKSKVSLNNVLDEVFSWVTASQEKIMEAQCELFISSFQDPKTITRVREIVGNISDGSSPHCAGVLKLGLKMAFEQRRQASDVLLQSSYDGGAWYNYHVAHTSVESNTCCQNCGDCNYGSQYQRYGGGGMDCLPCEGCGEEVYTDGRVRDSYYGRWY